jgi:hypothetical protein
MLLPALLMAFALAPALADQPTFDFETGDLQGWTVVEGSFDLLVSDMKEFRNRPGTPYNKQGTYYLSSIETRDYHGNDRMTGMVQSPTFTLETRYVSFLVGGGKGPGVYVALCLADTEDEVRAARGDNDEMMRRHIWDVSEFGGQDVYLRLVDRETGGWGHVTFDDFRPPTPGELAAIPPDASTPPESPLNPASREACEERVTSLRLAIADLAATFGDRYPNTDRCTERLDEIAVRLAGATGRGRTQKLREIAGDLDGLAREALVANPLVSGQPILYVVREQYHRDHHNTETMFQNGTMHSDGFRPGTALKAVDLATGEVRTILEAPEGGIRDPEVYFDGKRIVFSYRPTKADDYRIYEVNADGTGLRQITQGEACSDIDPTYLPNQQIVFASTRDAKVCACNVHIQANLFRVNADGSGLRQLGHNTLFEGHPSLLPDGRVLYSRWEYVDKHFGPAQGLWTMNPDGTGHEVFYGNNAWWPGAILDGHLIPGADLAIATMGSCHAPPFGEIAVIDRQLGFDGQAPIVISWPRVPTVRNNIDDVWSLPYRYEDPYPLSAKQFLCVRTIEPGQGDGFGPPLDKYGIFLLDVFGNEVLIHADDRQSCFDPMPIAPRPRPPIIPDHAPSNAAPEGTFFVYDVYRGTGMDAVKPGTVKWLRVVESPPKRFISYGDFNNGARQAPAMNWSDVVNKRIIGTVPVEADGSACFKAPANRFLFFQLLDADGMMVQSMRSGAFLQPGETASCIGCHEGRNTTVPSAYAALALRRPPSRPESWYGPERDFSYAAEVQPVFDRYCVSCHDYGEPAGEKLNLCGDKTLLFSVSYLEFHRKSGIVFRLTPPGESDPLIKVVNHGPPEVLPAYSWGSHRSRLTQVLLAGHEGVTLDRESLDRIATWIDLNAVYYGTFACVRPGNSGGRSPIDPSGIKRLNELTGMNVADEVRDTYVNLTRPELSLCLTANLPGAGPSTRFTGTDDPAYQQALAIIRAGAADLARRPRMDMSGAQADPLCAKLGP